MNNSSRLSLLWGLLAVSIIAQIVTGQSKASMRPVPIAPFQPGQAFWVEVRVGDPNTITNLYGVSFKLKSDQASSGYVDGSASIGSFLGANPLSFFRMVDNQTVDIAVTKTSSPGASGSGVIAKAQFICSSTGLVRFSLSDVAAVDQNGATIAIDTVSTVVTVTVAAASFKPVGITPFELGKPFWVEVRVGDPNAVTGLYGISFKMKSSSTTCTYVDGSAVAGGFLGSNPLSFIRMVNSLTVDIAVSKTSPPGTSGSGVIAKAQFLATSAGDVRFLLTDVAAVDQNGGAINLDTSSTVITVTKVNLKPVLNSRVPNTISTVSRNKPQVFAVSVLDPDSDPLTFTWKLNNAVVKTGTDTSYTAIFSDPHDTPKNITVVFSDPGGLKDSTSWDFRITQIVEDDAVPPTMFSLAQNYPNPFNPTTAISFQLSAVSFVSLGVYDVFGREVASLVDGVRPAGTYTVHWDGSGVASGVYYYRLRAGDTSTGSPRSFVETKRMMLVK